MKDSEHTTTIKDIDVGNKLKRDNLVGLDLLWTTPDEATELCAHHLKMAALYFEATPDDMQETMEEIEKIINHRVKKDYTEPAVLGARAFLKTLTEYYNKLEQDHP